MIAHIDNEYTMRGKPGVTGNMNRKFSKALGNQCQCDGNCRCGYVKHHRLHCGNCGWNEPRSYNALTDKFVCPSCKTESCINPNKSNNEMNNQENLNESSFSQGVVGAGMGNDGFLLWNNNPLGTDVSGLNESGFTQETVAYAIGSQGMSLNPFSENPIGSNESGFTQETVAYAIGEQGMSLNPFADYESEMQNNAESNFKLFGGGNLKGALMCANPVARDLFCGKFCKALGYMRKEDKSAFKRCKASCKINCKKAKQGKWKYPEAPEGAEEAIDPEELASQSEKQVAAMPADVANRAAAEADSKDNEDLRVLKEQQGKSKMTMWILIAVIAVILIVGTILLIRKNKS